MRVYLEGTEFDGEPINHVVIWNYPEIYESIKSQIVLKMINTRASDAIAILFNSERDGFVIYRDVRDDSTPDGDERWLEVAFIHGTSP